MAEDAAHALPAAVLAAAARVIVVDDAVPSAAGPDREAFAAQFAFGGQDQAQRPSGIESVEFDHADVTTAAARAGASVQIADGWADVGLEH
jgi:hypothetical protein